MTVSRGIYVPVRRKLLALIADEPDGLWTNRGLACFVYGVDDPSPPQLVATRKATVRLVREGALVQGDRLAPGTCESCGACATARSRTPARCAPPERSQSLGIGSACSVP
jgi:hypothetical protein